MHAAFNQFSFLVVSIAGWMNQHQQQVIEYLMEENRVLREQMGRRRMRFSDDQRRRLAAKAKKLGRRLLNQVATIVTPETLLAWHRKLIAVFLYSRPHYKRLASFAPDFEAGFGCPSGKSPKMLHGFLVEHGRV